MTWLREMVSLFRVAWQVEKDWWEVKRALRARMKEIRHNVKEQHHG